MAEKRHVIESVSFGRFVIRGEEHSERDEERIGAGKDIRIIGKRVSRWKERKGHKLSADMITGIYGEDVAVLVIGNGFHEALEVSHAVVEDVLAHGLEQVIVQPTPKACDTYNKLHAKGKKVALLAHGTC